MNLQRLEKNLCDNILEAQVKLGYDGRPMSLNYTTASLSHLTGADNDTDSVKAMLNEFTAEASPRFGNIGIRPIKDGFCLTVPSEGTGYVNKSSDGKEFIREFIALLQTHPTIDEVISLFRRSSENVTVTEMDNEEFQYLIYFPDGTPDDYRYCITAEEEIDGSTHITYHRFTKEDYEDLGF